ncbi:MAG: hypothetical protein ABJB74_20650 [Gemmatimonas sp.]
MSGLARSLVSLISMLTIAMAAWSSTGTAQSPGWTGVAAGSDDELYLRALQLLGTLPTTSWTSRPLANTVLDSLRRVIGAAHPWAIRFAPGNSPNSKHLRWRGASVDAGRNSAFVWGGNDGARWQGRGTSGTVSTGMLLRWKPLTIRVEPTLVYAQNLAFPVLPTESNTSAQFTDRMRPTAIDLPDRFGDKPLQRLDAGESEIRLEGHGFASAFSNRALFFGPAIRNPLILGNNAPGFAHLSFGTIDGVRTPVGRFAATIVYARLAQSGFAPDKREGSRLAAGTVVSWRPPSGKGFEIGAIRFYHRDWPANGLKLSDVQLPFGSLFGDRETTVKAPVDNQLLSLFARANSTRTGFEVFAEFGRNDRSSSLRDLWVEPEHNSAWSAGVLKVFGQRETSRFWTTRLEYLNGRTTSLERFRAQGTFYEHATLTQGHTNAGQSLGSPMLERTGGFEFAVDRWAQHGRTGFMIQERAMPLTRLEGVPADAARAQWAVELNGTRNAQGTGFGWRVGAVRDFNRTPGHDVVNYFLGGTLNIGER